HGGGQDPIFELLEIRAVAGLRPDLALAAFIARGAAWCGEVQPAGEKHGAPLPGKGSTARSIPSTILNPARRRWTDAAAQPVGKVRLGPHPARDRPSSSDQGPPKQLCPEE